MNYRGSWPESSAPTAKSIASKIIVQLTIVERTMTVLFSHVLHLSLYNKTVQNNQSLEYCDSVYYQGLQS